jgi:hypothetical protein
MSQREGRGYIEGLGEFRPAPALLGQDPWREVWNLVSGLSDDHWRSMSDREWFEFVMNDVLEDLRAVYRCGSPRSGEEYVAQNHAYRAAYAWLAAALLAWAEAIEARQARQVAEEGKEDERCTR